MNSGCSTSAIRRVLEAARPARNAWSSPDARSTVLADVRVRSEARPRRVEVTYPAVEVDAAWTSGADSAERLTRA